MKYKINLLPQKETSLIEKLMYFALNYLRYIIVITQLVVIGVFFYRFQIDQRIVDLKEAVDQKKEIVEIVLPLLQEASRIDKKTKEIEIIIKQQNDFQSMIQYFLSTFPETATLNAMEVVGDSIKIVGTSSNPTHLQAFFLVLKKDNKFSKIEFKNIKKIDYSYSFSLNLNRFKN